MQVAPLHPPRRPPRASTRPRCLSCPTHVCLMPALRPRPGCLELNRACPSPLPFPLSFLHPVLFATQYGCPRSPSHYALVLRARRRVCRHVGRSQAGGDVGGSGCRRGTLPSSRSAAQSLALPGQRRPTRRPRDTRTITTAGTRSCLGNVLGAGGRVRCKAGFEERGSEESGVSSDTERSG